MAGLNVLWMCRVAAQRDSWHAFDILCLSPCLGDWGCGRQYKKGSLSAYIVCMSAVYMLLLWKALSLGLSIYIFINHHSHWEGGIEESFKCKLTLCLHTTHTHTYRLAVSHSPFYSIPPSPGAPCPQRSNNLLVWLSPRETRQWTVNLLINTSIN